MSQLLKASTTPNLHLELLSYEGQPATNRIYTPGFESYFNALPVLRDGDPLLQEKVDYTGSVIKKMALRLNHAQYFAHNDPGEGNFKRMILAMESPLPIYDQNNEFEHYKEGVELVAALWGKGFSSPVHGHAAGMMHEEILFGRMLVHTYRIVDFQRRIVRPVETIIAEPGTLVSQYRNTPEPWEQAALNPRPFLVHNFTALDYSVSLHYLPEHTRDGRDNGFTVTHFENYYDLHSSDVEEISAAQGLSLRKGEVVLVRSSNVPEYGDHFIVITGHPIMKPNGLRPQDRVIQAPNSRLLQEAGKDFILLRLKADARNAFLKFHDISVSLELGEVVFPNV